MQCTDYFSGHHYPRNRTTAATGSLWPQFDSGVFYRNVGDYNIMFHPPNTDQCLSYSRDLLRDRMLKHEAIFKYQIYELHRLYTRQRELMCEVQMKTLATNYFGSPSQSDVSQKALQQIPYRFSSSLRDYMPSRQGVKTFQNPSTSVPGNGSRMGSDLHALEHNFKEFEGSSSSMSKLRKTLWDVDLRTELYMDTNEEERLEKKKSTEILSVQRDSSIDISNSFKKSNVVPSEETYTNMSLRCQRMNCAFDLNEPVQVYEPTHSTISMYSNISKPGTFYQHQDLSESSRSKSTVIDEIVHGIPDEKGVAGCNDRAGVGSEFAKNEQDFIFSNGHRLFSSSVTTSSSSPVPLSNDTNDIGSFNTPVLNRTSGTSTGSTLIRREYICPNLNDAACSQSLGSINTESHSTDEECSAPSCLRGLTCTTKSTVDLNLNVKPSSSFPKMESFLENVNFADGMVNLDLNALPSGHLSETEDSQDKVLESLNGNSGLGSSLRQLNEVGDNPDHPIHSTSNPFSAFTSITVPSSSSENEDIQNHEKNEIPTRVVPHTSSEPEHCGKDATSLGTEESGEKVSVTETCIHLPSTFVEEDFSQIPSVADTIRKGFEAPDSADKEASQPREQLLEDSNKNLDRIAAEAIVSMSLSGEQQCLKKNGISGPLEASFDCLYWFSGIVSSIAGFVENEFNDDALSDAGPGIDFNQLTEHSAAKTLKFKGIKVEDSFVKTIDQKNKITDDGVWPDISRKEKRPRNRGKQKEIQAEASNRTVKGRKNVGKVCLDRGKKRQSSKPLSKQAGRQAAGFLSERQHAYESSQSFMESWLLGWGKKNWRQNHKRAKA